MQSAALSLFRFDRPSRRAWVIWQMAVARLSLARVQGLSFWKLCGSGTGEGFTPKPNWSTWAILTVWDSPERARAGTADEAVFRRWRAQADESWTVFLEPYSARGEWAGVPPFAPHGAPGAGPLSALTRATVKPAKALRFWGRVPDISRRLGDNSGVVFKIGIGEVPLLHQVTFSIWPDLAQMNAFARTGPHAEAIRAVRDEGWFSEELYARFRVTGSAGTWNGTDPLSGLLEAQA